MPITYPPLLPPVLNERLLVRSGIGKGDTPVWRGAIPIELIVTSGVRLPATRVGLLTEFVGRVQVNELKVPVGEVQGEAPTWTATELRVSPLD